MAITKELIQRQIDWSRETFGPNKRSAGILEHMRKEVEEIRKDPTDVVEWADYAILAVDGAWNAGGASAGDIVELYRACVARRSIVKEDMEKGRHFLLLNIRIKVIERLPEIAEGWVAGMLYASIGAQVVAGVTLEEFESAYAKKIETNAGRKWKDWRTVGEGQPIEHIKS